MIPFRCPPCCDDCVLHRPVICAANTAAGDELCCPNSGVMVRVPVGEDDRRLRWLAMSAAAWDQSQDPKAMLRFLDGQGSDRKFRLFACHCCRQLCDRNSKPSVWKVAEISERFADGVASLADLRKAVRALTDHDWPWDHGWAGSDSATESAEENDAWLAWRIAEATAQIAVGNSALAWQAALLREMFNPFRPYPVPVSWPALVVDLAQQLYDGGDVRLVLHDALIDAGHSELAVHFRQATWHPKGCWPVDLLLGKK